MHDEITKAFDIISELMFDVDINSEKYKKAVNWLSRNKGSLSPVPESFKSPNIKTCENCLQKVDIDTNEGHGQYCNFVYGRRGWRQLGAYDS